MPAKNYKIIGMQSKKLMDKFINANLDCYYPDWNDRDLDNSILITTAPYELESIKSSLRAKISIGIQDGVFDFANSFYHPFFNNKKYKLNFPSVNNVVLCFGKKEAIFIESLNSNNLMVKTYIPSYIKNTLKSADEFSNEDAIYDVMITTANTAYFSDEEFDKLTLCLKRTTENLLSAGYRVCFRIFDKRIINALHFEDIENINSGGFLNAAAKTKCIFTTPSTLAVESMILGIPTATFIYRDTPLTTQTGWLVYDPSLAVNIVDSMLSNDNERFMIQKALVDNYLSSDFDNVTEVEITKIAEYSKVDNNFRVSFAESVLLSKWNFNIKFFFKKLIYKLKR